MAHRDSDPLNCADELARRQLALLQLEQMGAKVVHVGSGTVTAAMLEQMVERVSLPRAEREGLWAEELSTWDEADQDPHPAPRTRWWRRITSRKN